MNVGTTGSPRAVVSDPGSIEPCLQVRQLAKRFGGTHALADVDLELHRGEIHALLGENGAGKSTLIKILAGIHAADQGEVIGPLGPLEQAGRPMPGIAFGHQDLGLVETMSVTENIAIGTRFARRAGLIDWRASRRAAATALDAIGGGIDLDELVGRLSAAQKSMIAIARAVALDARVLVVDEPTATLPEEEVERFHAVLRRLVADGLGILYVTHRLDEVFRIADRASVLRDGRLRFTGAVADIDVAGLVEHIVGRRVDELFPDRRRAFGDPVLQVQGLRSHRVGPVSFSVHAGEVVGLVGLRDAGQEIVGRMLAGDRPVVDGSIVIEGVASANDAASRDARTAIESGLGFISSKRVEESLCPQMAVRENLFLNPALLEAHRIGGAGERDRALAALERFDVRPRDSEVPIASLSGGNQQKIVIARWMALGRRVLVLEEPTSGVDVGAKAEIYRLLDEALQQGLAVVLVSSDFEEVAGLCDRAILFSRDRQVGALGRDALTVADLVRATAGGAVGDSAGDPVGNTATSTSGAAA